ncbi:MAG: EAL domain-containing protein, partial [Erysipelotrichaceae bacterium]|nr:EAL domain-containing protein [Erysipelotrichaceae bacterium]
FTVIFSMIDDIYKGEMSQRKLNIYEELSVKDALTSLGNRRAFDIHMEEIDKSPFDNAYLMFLDVNGLKEANDHYGHAQGDRLLKRTAEVIRKTFADCGCYRIGGDEFAVIVENPVMSDKEYLQILADNVKEENRNEIFELSVAVGLSQLYDGDTRRSLSLWKSLADKEMYAEKLRSRLMLGENQLEADDIDEQTGILNQVGFRKHLMRVVMEHPKKQFALWYCDIKKFKFVNDFFGYEKGDELLKFWATTTSSCLGELDICGHWIADTLVMLTTYTNDEVLHQRFDSICNVIGPYLKDPRMNYYVELTAGIYLLQQKDMESPDLNQMMDWAHMAQKSVKTKIGSNMAIFGEEMWQSQWRELYINQSLEKAIESKEIEVYFQPQYNYMTGEIIGAEALSRWKHSSLGWISPGEFIPALEKTGAIHILDRYVWEQACILMSKWRDSDMLLPVSISVNISRMDFLDENIVQILKDLVQKYNLPPSMLRLEITESAYIEQPDMLVGVVNLLHQNGFTVELDDFGSGFSSLNVLKDMQVDIIKMDVRFIETTKELKKGSQIIRAMIRMAHELEIPVITEGVETKEQAVFISGIGCAMMQGYYFSKPIPVEQFEDLLMTARERKNRMEEDKKHREKDLERVINSPVYMLWYSDYLLDSNLAIIRVDENFERATGYTWDDVISNHMHQMDLIPPDDLQDYMSLVNKTQNTGKIAGIQHRIRRKDGTDVMVYCTGTPAVDELTGEYNTEVRIQMTEE